MREPVLGDFDNGLDNLQVKHVDILDDDGEVGGTILATEWFAELCFASFWQVNPAWLADWLAAQEPPEPEPEGEAPANPPADPEPVEE